ncbi:MAG TPA: hypothetical protein VN420_04835 [Candidatus Fimivivens sp.]|nr:hypothetical protein [Candidatus Fimivivens sp.]
MNRRKAAIGTISVLFLASLGLMAGQALAQDGNTGDHGWFGRENRSDERGRGDNRQMGRKFEVSDAAKTACSGKSTGDPCAFTGTKPGSTDSTTFDGTCRNLPKVTSESSTTTVLACMPSPKNGQGGALRGNEMKNESGKTALERAQAMKTWREKEIARIETRVEKIITFLKSKEVDTTAISDDFATFKTKAQTVLDKIDAYIIVLKASGSSQTDITTARDAIRTAGQDMRTYFQGTLRVAIKAAIDTIKV